MFRENDEVVNLKATEWGIGKVLQHEANGRVRVCFDQAGEKLIALNHARLIEVGIGIGPALELGKARGPQVVIEVIGTYPLKYEKP